MSRPNAEKSPPRPELRSPKAPRVDDILCAKSGANPRAAPDAYVRPRQIAATPQHRDIQKEPQIILEMYGAEAGRPSYANACLMARPLVKSGVRFVQIYQESWDQHGNLVKDLRKYCEGIDRVSGVIMDNSSQAC